MTDEEFDVIVVGSGPAGANAAYTLVKNGFKVAIIDGGLDSKKQIEHAGDLSHIGITESSNAYELIQGSSYAFDKTYRLLKIKSAVEIIQCLTKGGLSEFWHGICDFFSPEELEKTGLPSEEIQREYQAIAKLVNLKSGVPLDLHSKLILKTAQKKDSSASIVYKTPSAASYYTSATVENLKRFKNLTYIPRQMVLKIKDGKDFAQVFSISVDDLSKSVKKARYLILAAGSVNTTRILLRSFNLYNFKTGFLTKPHYLIACLHLKTLIKRGNIKKVKIGQLAISSNQTEQGLSNFFVQLYRFNPLAITKALKYVPLPKIITEKVLSKLAPSLMVADVRFPAFGSENKFCRLKKSADGDTLEVCFKETNQELINHKVELNKIKKRLRSLGLLPLKTAGDYVTAHYAGGVPFSSKVKKMTVDKNCRLHKTKRVYIADSATWRVLPAKSPTLTIMANALRVGKIVAGELQ